MSLAELHHFSGHVQVCFYSAALNCSGSFERNSPSNLECGPKLPATKGTCSGDDRWIAQRAVRPAVRELVIGSDLLVLDHPIRERSSSPPLLVAVFAAWTYARRSAVSQRGCRCGPSVISSAAFACGSMSRS